MARWRAGFLAAALAAAVGLPIASVCVRAEDQPAASKEATARPPTPAQISPAQISPAQISPAQISNVAAGQSEVPAPNPNCPGNPSALGTSRVLPVDFTEYQQVGRMQYPDTLPLNDKEVVITFDDGPLPPYTTAALDILAAQCVKATFFMVGEMARAFPATVRQVYEQGHTIGTHSDHHPVGIGRLPLERMQGEVDGGIADVSAAFGGDSRYLAPFFRIPGLDTSTLLESELAKRELITFSSDVVADDWHRGITPAKIISLAMGRLDKRGKGILLLHDIHQKTVAALPGLLDQLKAGGYHVVQVVPSAAYEMAMAHRPRSATLASAVPGQLTLGNAGAAPVWPQAADASTPDDVALPVPDAASFEPDAGLNDDRPEVNWPVPPPAEVAPPVSKSAARRGGRHREASKEAKSKQAKSTQAKSVQAKSAQAKPKDGKVHLAHAAVPEKTARSHHPEHDRGHARARADGHRADLINRPAL